MILKLRNQNTKRSGSKLILLLLLSPFIFKSQTTIPSTTVSGCLKVNQTTSTGHLDVEGSGRIDSSLVVGDTMRAQDVMVTGNARIAGDVNIGGNLVFKNGTGIGVTTGATPGSEIFSYGRSVTGILSTLNPCFNPNPPWQTHQFGGLFQIYDNGPSGYTGGNILTMQSWFNGSSIDVAGQGGLLMNYFCGKDIYLGTGSGTGGAGGMAGANVYTGDMFYARKNVQIGNPGQPIDPNVSLNLFLNGTNSGLKLWSGAIPTNKLIHDNYDQFIVMGNGKTSIGVNATVGAAPYKTLTVNGDASFANYGGVDGANAFEILGNNQTPTNRGIGVDNIASGNMNFFLNSNTSSTGKFKFKNGTGSSFDLMTLDLLGKLSTIAYGPDAIEVKNFGTNKIVFAIKANGQTFIGDKKVQTTNAHANAILQVGGKITCQELVVLDPVKWADFVFEKDYKLTPLNEVEKYYLTNSHLKDVPSAKEVKENGINSAEMDAILLQKIEELTLYTVDLNKQVQELKKENIQLKNKK